MRDVRSTLERMPVSVSSAAVGVAAGVASVLGSYGAAGFTPGFVVAPVESTLSRLMPGQVITFAITVLGNLGQKLNLAFASLLVVGVVAAVAVLATGLGRRLDRPGVPTLATLVAVWALAAAVTLQPVQALGAAAGAGLVVGASEVSVSLGRFPEARTEDGNRRRRVVSALGTAAAASVVGVVAGRSQTDEATDGSSNGGGSAGDRTFDVADRIADAEAKSFDIEGMDPAISEGFYQVDISSVNPDIAPEGWALKVTGAVENELALSYEDIREMDHEHRFSTIRCVGENLNGHKMDNALWTGAPVASIIEEAAPTSDCNCVMLRADGDGFFEEFPLDALRPGMLAYGMNGRPLPRGHGAPVRAVVPGHWGEVNVKWLTEIEFLEKEQDGYWEKRGWHGTGPVKTVAKLHGTERRDDGRVVVGGHAYAGLRGISAVEVSTDGGDSWTEAELAERLGGATGPATDVGGGDEFAADAWRSWRHVYDPPEGPHEVVVRAYERDGTRQPEESTGSFPSGPSGWVSETVDPSNL